MKRGTRRAVPIIGVGVMVAGAFLLAACGSSSPQPAKLASSPKPVAQAGSTDAESVPVSLGRFKVGVAEGLTPGHKTLQIVNNDTIQHELLVFRSDLDPSAYPLQGGDIDENGPGVTKISDGDNIDPGKAQTRVVDLSAPGRYLFVCNLPGHFKAGMYSTVTVAAAEPTEAVTLREFKVQAASTTLSPGIYNFTINNAGAVQHELLVFHTDLAPGAFPLDGSGSINEDGPGMNKVSDGENIDPGKTQTRSVDLTRPGTYVFVCNIPGHFRAGMFTTVTVK